MKVYSESAYKITYYANSVGDYVVLRYTSAYSYNVCTSKEVGIKGSVVLSRAQTKPIQVIVKLWWGDMENNNMEIQLYQMTLGDNYSFETAGYQDPDEYDISGYFPSGSKATLHMSVEFKFVSSGVDLDDQQYLASVWGGWNFELHYYLY